MDILARLQEHDTDMDVYKFRRLGTHEQRQQIVALAEKHWAKWMAQSHLYTDGPHRGTIARMLARDVRHEVREKNVLDGVPTGFWEIIVLNVVIMIIKWLWDKWQEGE